jgi:hypothetical protein
MNPPPRVLTFGEALVGYGSVEGTPARAKW